MFTWQSCYRAREQALGSNPRARSEITAKLGPTTEARDQSRFLRTTSCPRLFVVLSYDAAACQVKSLWTALSPKTSNATLTSSSGGYCGEGSSDLNG
jgi:hypothetical protein